VGWETIGPRLDQLYTLMVAMEPGGLLDRALRKTYTLMFQAEGMGEPEAVAAADELMVRWAQADAAERSAGRML
jgi:hypothetical protein